MSVEQARGEYLYMASVAIYHPRGCAWCANRGGPPDNHWWLKADAASIAFDNAVAAHYAGPRPARRWPWWLTR